MASRINQDSFFSLTLIKGHYKHRNIILRNDYLSRGGPFVDVIIVPLMVYKKERKFITLDPYPLKPTPDTYLKGKEIYHKNSTIFLGGTLAEQEIINIFEELTKAAEIVESGAPYHKQ